MRKPDQHNNQLSFDALLGEASSLNQERERTRTYGHLPETLDDALPYYRNLLEDHHRSMLEGDAEAVRSCRKLAHDLAFKLNGYEPGIIADDDSPGCLLDQRTRAAEGVVPLWGQTGSFEVVHNAMRVSIEMDGIFGIGASYMAWLGFSAHAVEHDKPFLSDTGYRSFLGVGGDLVAGYTPAAFVAGIISTYVQHDLRGRLKRIVPLRVR